MKRALAIGTMLVFSAGQAMAVPPGTGSNCVAGGSYQAASPAQLSSLLGGNTACYPTSAPFTNQELHSGGTITDYKKGPSDPKDPSTQVGTYTITGTSDATITYNYTGGGSFAYKVFGSSPFNAGSNYDFCPNGIAPQIVVRVKAGGGAC
jgi:hypothetical protein